MSSTGDTPNRLERLVAYPCSPDDEVRESLYGIRKPNPFKETKGRYEYGDTISVGGEQSALTQSVDKMFKCSWPNVLLEKDLKTLDPPAYLKENATFASSVPVDAGYNAEVYKLHSVETEQDLKRYDDELRCFRYALCTMFDAVRSCGPPWSAAYNSLMESVWHDDLQGANISINFRPRWSLYPTTGKPGEWPVIVPDVVFSAKVPISNHRLSKAQQYHPAHAFDQATQDTILEIPLLVVEYDKIELDGRPAKSEAHRKHLEAAIISALPMHTVLGLRTPIYGVFIDRYAADYCAGTLVDVNGMTMPAIHDIVIPSKEEVNFYKERLHILHLQYIIAHLRESASSILDELEKDTTFLYLRPYVKFPHQETFRCAPNGRVINTSRPPLVVDDDTLQHIFSLDLKAITSWLSKAGIIVNDNTVQEPPKEIQDCMCLISEPKLEPVVAIQAAVADALKGLPDRAQSLAIRFLSSYRHGATTRDASLPDTEKATLSFDIRASLNICLHASDLVQMSANVLYSHAASSHWSVIYDSLFLRAKQHYEGKLMFFESYPQWNLHRKLRSVRSKTGRRFLEEIRPSCALSYALVEDHVLMQNTSHTPAIAHLKPEFTVECTPSQLTGGTKVDIPVMVAEYVLVPDDSGERAKHLAHLAMTMRSALALWEVHCLKGPVIGFLMERNIVETKLGWIDDKGKCIIHDVSEFTFDLVAPQETFRLFNVLKAYWQEASRSQLEHRVDVHSAQAISRLCDSSYQSWRDLPDDDANGDEYGEDIIEIGSQ